MSTTPTIAIIGASHAGTGVAKAFEKKLAPGQAKIILIEAREEFYNNMASPRSVVDAEFAKQTFHSFKNVFTKKDIGSLKQAKVSKVTEKEITFENGETLAFDFLVIASGARYLAPFKTEHIKTEDAMAQITFASAKIKGAQKILIGGGGAVGVEVAAEIKAKFPEKVLLLLLSSVMYIAHPALHAGRYNCAFWRLSWLCDSQ